MNEQPPRRELRHAIAETLHKAAAAERNQRSQRRVRGNGTSREDRARPREFDENGFPVPQATPGFVQRVARLLKPS